MNSTTINLRAKKSLSNKKNRIYLFIGLMLTLAINILKLVYNKFSIGQILLLNILYLVIYVCFVVEFVLRLKAFYEKKGKQGIIEYFKFNKAEPLYFIIGLIAAVFGVISSMTQSRMNTAELLQWCILLKMPSVLRHFDDELVFNVISKLIMLLLVVMFVIPFLNIIALALSSPHQIVNILPQKFTLYSVDYIISYMPFWRAMGISLFVTVLGTIGSVSMMVMAAYPLSKPQMPLRRTMMIFFLIVMLFSGGMAPKIILMNILGMLDSVWALILPSFINVFNLLLLKGFFEGLPAELEESAKLDGANNYQILFTIIVPLSLPMVATVSMFTAVVYWNNFNNALMYIVANKDLYPIPMFIRDFTNISEQGLAMENPVLADHLENVKMALMLLSIIPIILVYPFILKTFTKGVAVGSVKG